MLKNIFWLSLVLYFGCSPKKSNVLSEESFFRIFEKKYDSLRTNLKDSLDKGIENVNDLDCLYTSSEKKQLDSIIADFARNTRLSIIILTFDSLMSSGDSVAEVTRIVGIKNRVSTTIGISRAYKTMHIWNDSLINTTFLDQYQTKKVIDSFFIPSFRNGRYFDGTFHGLKEIISIITFGQKMRKRLKLDSD